MFKSPIIGTDTVTKGTFTILWANILLDYDEDDGFQNTRASGSVIIRGLDNPLLDALIEHPLRVQGLVASVVFGTEKKLIKFQHITDYDVTNDELFKEIELSLVFEILDNLEYLEEVIEYKDNNNL
jgi:hypothetical protein